MISSLSKLADKSFIVSFVLPALLTITALAAIFPDLALSRKLNEAFLGASTTKLDDLALFVLGVWAIALVLSMTNTTQYKILEGYLPPFCWFTSWTFYHLDRYRALRKTFDDLNAAWRDALDKKQPFPDAARVGKIRLDMLTRYPDDENAILPTSFGNAIRAFELYPRDVYRADGVNNWLRLGAVVPQNFQAALSDVRSQVDFLVNVAYAALAIALVVLMRAAVTVATVHAVWRVDVARDLAIFEAGLALSYLAYGWATAQAVVWGDLVKSAFDCYLPALAKQLGYTLPADTKGRQAFWAAIDQVTIYRNVDDLNDWLTAHPQPAPAPPDAAPVDKTDPSAPGTRDVARALDADEAAAQAENEKP